MERKDADDHSTQPRRLPVYDHPSAPGSDNYGGRVMPGSEITLGELARNQSAMEGRIAASIAEIKRDLSSLQFVHQKAYDAEMKALTDRVEELEESKKWLARTVAGAFLIAFLAPILVALVVSR